MTISDRIKLLLQKTSKMQLDLAASIDAPKSTVNHWLTGGSDPTSRYIMPICRFFGVTPEYLLEGVEPAEPEPVTPPIALESSVSPANALRIVCETEDEHFLVETLRTLDAGGKRALLGCAESERRRVAEKGSGNTCAV